MDQGKAVVVGMSCRFPEAQDIAGLWHSLLQGVEHPIAHGTQHVHRPESLISLAYAALEAVDIQKDHSSRDTLQVYLCGDLSPDARAALLQSLPGELKKRFPGDLNVEISPEGCSSFLNCLGQASDALQGGRCTFALICGVDLTGGIAVVLTTSDTAYARGLSAYAALHDVNIYPERFEHSARSLREAYGEIGYLEVMMDRSHKEEAILDLQVTLGELDEHVPRRPMSLSTEKDLTVSGALPFARAVLALSNKVIPPDTGSSGLEVGKSFPFYMHSNVSPWIRHPQLSPRRAAVCSLATGGENSVILLEEVGRDDGMTARSALPGLDRSSELIVLSAESISGLAERVEALRVGLSAAHKPLRLLDIAYTCFQAYSPDHDVRLMLVCHEMMALRDMLDVCSSQLRSGRPDFGAYDDIYFTERARQRPGKVAWIFPGMGFPGLLGTYADHLQELCLQFPEAREVFDAIDFPDPHSSRGATASWYFFPPQCFTEEERSAMRGRLAAPRTLSAHGVDDLESRNLAPFGLFAANYMGWVLLRQLKVPVDMLFGQSFGDITSLCVAGVLEFEDMIPHYWKAIVDASFFMGKGCLALAGTDEEHLAQFISQYPSLSIALYIAPNLHIVGGEKEELDNMVEGLRAEGIWTQLVPYPPVHTPSFSELREIMEAMLEDIPLHTPNIPVYSAVRADTYPSDIEGIKQVLLSNVDNPLRLWQTTKKMYDDGARIFLQAGGGAMSHAHARTVAEKGDVVSVALDVDYRSAVTQIHHLCATLLASGVEVDLEYLFRHREPVAVDLSRAAVNARQELASAVSKGDAEAPEAQSQSVKSNNGGMPFIDEVLHLVPEQEIVVERTLDLKNDLHLIDHLFVHAPGVKEPSECQPILPMTFSIEIMAEVSACISPGHGLIGFENISASRWIVLEDIERLPLRISAYLADYDENTEVKRLKAAVYVEDADSPAVEGTVLFGRQYVQSLSIDFGEPGELEPFSDSAQKVYEKRRLFHGPLLRSVSATGMHGDGFMSGELEVLPTHGLFASTQNPELLTDPMLLDGVGQLVGLWAQDREMYIFPIRIEKLEFYRPTPSVGTKAPTYVRIYEVGLKTLKADVEVLDGEGGVWMRIKGWQDWVFHWERAIYDFRRNPTKHVIGRDAIPEGLPPGFVCKMVSEDEFQDFDMGMDSTISRFFLSREEMDEFEHITDKKRRKHWIFGRVAAKDAVREWIAGKNAPEMLHPASVVIVNDESGRPLVRLPDGYPDVPHISISHSGGFAIAVAGNAPVGVDIEEVSTRSEGFLEISFSDEEAQMLSEASNGDFDAWVTRLWCAKEAASKALGRGLAGSPQAYHVSAIGPDGEVVIDHRDTGERLRVLTMVDDRMAIACTLPH